MKILHYTTEPARVGHLTFWDSMPHPGCLQQKDGSYLACVRFRGPDLASALNSALVLQATRLNSLIRRLGGGWGLMVEARRHAVTGYPQSVWPDPVSRLVDDERRQHYQQADTFFHTDTVLTLVYRPPAQPWRGWERVLYRGLPQTGDDGASVQGFTEEVDRIAGLLGECCVDVTRLTERSLLTYLASTVNPVTHPVHVPTPACYLDTYLTATDLHREYLAGARPVWLRWPRLGDEWLRCVSIKAYPVSTQPGILDSLSQLPIAHRAVLRYIPLEHALAVRELRKYRRAHYGMRKGVGAMMSERLTGKTPELLEQIALDHETEANIAQAELQRGDVSYGYLTQTVVVSDTDFARATAKAEQIAHILNAREFVAKVETVNTMDAWVGSLPGNMYANVRRPLLHSYNLAHLFPATSPWAGPERNDHLQGPPLMRTTGRGHTPFNLDTYDGDVGMAYIAGPVGAGKSFALAMMACQWLKYPGAAVRVFDTGQSMRCMTYAVGGQWFDIAQELARLAGGEGKLDDATTRPWGSPWLPPLHNHWQCFELESLLQTPDMLAHVMRGLLRTLKDRMTGNPTLFMFDEGHLYLMHKVLEEGIDDYIRGLRKKNGAVVFATQSISDAVRSNLGPIISDSAMTRILLANFHALEPETAKIYQGWGLNSRECQLIAEMVPKRDYYYQGRHGTRIFQFDPGPVALALAGKTRKPDLALMDQLYHGDGPQFAQDWLHAQGLYMQADYLKTLQEDVCKE